jgi:hypothetical protein
MVSRRQQQRSLRSDRIAARGFAMAFPCTSCVKSGKKCIVDQSSKLCSECTRHARKCDVDRSADIEKLDIEVDRLLNEARKVEDESLRLGAQARRLRKQADFLGGRVRHIIKGELDGLESLAGISPDIDAGFSDPPVIEPPPLSPTASEFWSALGLVETSVVSPCSEPGSSTVPRSYPTQDNPSI